MGDLKMAKYYKFCFSAGFAGTERCVEVRFADDASETEVRETFNNWYEGQRRDRGYFEEIYKEEARNSGINED